MESIRLYSGSNLKEVESILNKDFPGCGSKLVYEMLRFVPEKKNFPTEFTIHKEGDRYQIHIHLRYGIYSDLALWSELYEEVNNGKKVVTVDRLGLPEHEGRELERSTIIEVPIEEE